MRRFSLWYGEQSDLFKYLVFVLFVFIFLFISNGVENLRRSPQERRIQKVLYYSLSKEDRTKLTNCLGDPVCKERISLIMEALEDSTLDTTLIFALLRQELDTLPMEWGKGVKGPEYEEYDR